MLELRDRERLELVEARIDVEPEHCVPKDQQEDRAVATTEAPHNAVPVGRNFLQVRLEWLLDRGTGVIEKVILVLEVEDALVHRVTGGAVDGPDNIRVAVQVVQVASLVGLVELHKDPRRRLSFESGAQGLHLEAFEPHCRVSSPVEDRHRVEVKLAKLRRAKNIQLPHHNPDLRLKRRMAHPEREDLREVNDLRMLVFRQGGPHLWIVVALNG
mmetsp:Transcript_66944/g.186916  ORF Transcript_66944/g.186916 Transcript_66944/m.186916 type:complete len:214 (+) Transcript_66944:781-1422(+)